jgi:phosphoenolpyruvate-protein kinase (PTS system EI component)
MYFSSALIVRTLDAGGDKQIYPDMPAEQNPFGRRAICPSEPELFRLNCGPFYAPATTV